MGSEMLPARDAAKWHTRSQLTCMHAFIADMQSCQKAHLDTAQSRAFSSQFWKRLSFT